MRRTFQYSLIIIMLTLIGITPSNAQVGNFTGSISNDEPYIVYPVNVTQAGQTLSVDLQATSGNLDTYLMLLDKDSATLAFNDDRTKGGDSKDTNALLIVRDLPVDNYFVVATRYNDVNGTTTGDYEISIDFFEPGILNEDYDISDAALAAAGFPDLEPKEQAAWTILAYYGADTNLEPGILNDFNEFELAGGSDNTVRVIAMIDRAPGHTDIDGDWQDTRLYEISADVTGDTQNFPPTPDSQPLAELGEVDMGEGEAFAQFLTWALKTYPADHYAIAFASHGAGWEGLITDDTSDGNILSIPELQKAISQAQTSANVSTFDVLINDACLMSSVEYYASLAPFFDISFASPEIIVDPALDMTLFTTLVRENPDVDLTDVGTQLVNTYMSRDIQGFDPSVQAYFNHAVTNLQNYDPVVTAVDNFAKLINEDIEAYGQLLGEARSNAYTYSAFLGFTTQIDLGDFMRRIVASSKNQALTDASQEVIDALDSVRLYSEGGANIRQTNGYYNIYFPSVASEFRIDYLVESPLAEWGRMLEGYYANFTPVRGLRGLPTPADNKAPLDISSGSTFLPIVEEEPTATVAPTEASDVAQPTIEPTQIAIEIPSSTDEDTDGMSFHAPVTPWVNLTSVYPQRSSTERPVSIQYQVGGRNIASGNLIVDSIRDDGSQQRLMQLPLIYEQIDEDGNIQVLSDWASGIDAGTILWDVSLYTLRDDTQEFPEFLVETADTLAVSGRYRANENAAWWDVSLIFDYETGRYQQAISSYVKTNALAPVRIPPGSEFQTYREIILPDGTTNREPGNIYDFDSLEVYDLEAPSGDYELGVEVITFSGLVGKDTITVTVDNSLNTGLRTFSDVDYGFEFLLPDDWYDVEELLEDYALITFNEAETAAILIQPYVQDDISEFDLEDFVYFFVEESDYADEIYEDSIEYGEFDGEDAVLFNFYSEAFDWYWEGFGAVVYNEVTNTVLLVAVYIDEDEYENEDLIDEVLTIIDENFAFVKQGNTRTWEYTLIDEEGYIEMPSRINWFKDQYSDEEEAKAFFSPVEEYTPDQPFLEVYVFPSEADRPTDTLDIFIDEYVSVDVEDYEVTAPEIYYGEYETWNALLYTGLYEGTPIIGRAYVTTFEGDFGEQTVFVYFEAPADNIDVIYDTFEPMIDGIRIYDEEGE